MALSKQSAEIEAYLHQGAFDLPKQSIDGSQRLIWALRALEGHQAQLRDSLSAATPEQLSLVHSQAYVNGIYSLSASEQIVQLDPELRIYPQSWLAASSAAETLATVTQSSLKEKNQALRKLPFCLSRPGSHHAGSDYGLGLCIFNNLAYAAASALQTNKVNSVAILDFDIHHGNGTEEIFAEEERVLTVSIHQYPFYPGSGKSGSEGAKSNLNLTMQAGDGDKQAREAYDYALEAIDLFQPDLILLEAGVDGHAKDWTSDTMYEDQTFYYFGQQLAQLQTALKKPLVLEVGGGYTEEAVVNGLSALIKGLGEK